jgi:predicted metalloenzyme YecM
MKICGLQKGVLSSKSQTSSAATSVVAAKKTELLNCPVKALLSSVKSVASERLSNPTLCIQCSDLFVGL